ncbi:MAG: glycosyltransferase family 2 protein [Candidatus Methanoperedens sp.]|nr:glycosyltransferase family 2 protein [Candidatus Methanoperedens sp.]MCZ7394438.1 glycosyltransferase family 2 protein [Candidatus Methanoperedens sp.]
MIQLSDKQSCASHPDVRVSKLTVIIPAYNEKESIADTIRSLKMQTVPAEEIIVVDDCSTDGTGDVARSCGVTVIRPPLNTGSKAGAQNFALSLVKTEFTMAIDADTTLAPDAIEILLPAFDDPRVAAACGFVLPRHVGTIWERGRYIEYLLAFTWYKPIQDYYEKPLISSGCFSMYRTEILKANGGWSRRTLAEDMDLTWSFYLKGHCVRFVPEAVCYPIEPHNYTFMRKQLRRWSHGYVQNVRLHWKGILEIPYLRSFVAVATWDAVVASLVYLFLLPLIALLFANPIILIGYVIDIPVVLIPVLSKSMERKEVLRSLASLPSFFILRTVNGFFILEAFFTELVLKKQLLVYEKGH